MQPRATSRLFTPVDIGVHCATAMFYLFLPRRIFDVTKTHSRHSHPTIRRAVSLWILAFAVKHEIKNSVSQKVSSVPKEKRYLEFASLWI
jgi:hypothetical protein